MKLIAGMSDLTPEEEAAAKEWEEFWRQLDSSLTEAEQYQLLVKVLRLDGDESAPN